MNKPNRNDHLRKQTWNNAFYCYATLSIFETRKRKYSKRLKLLRFFSVSVLFALGAATYYIGTNYLELFIIIAGILAFIHSIISIWALVNHWEEQYAYAISSVTDNHRLYIRYKGLAEHPDNDIKQFVNKLEVLHAEDSYRSSEDYKQEITEEEKRYGHRTALRQFRRKCIICDEIPTTLIPTNCDICGNYSRRLIK